MNLLSILSIPVFAYFLIQRVVGRHTAVLTAAVISFLLPVRASAGPAINLSAEWLALGSEAPGRSVVLREGKSQPFVQVIPRSAFQTGEDALDAKGNLLLPRGTTLTATRERTDTRCEVKRRKGNRNFVCLIDSDGDGRFESGLRMWINSELFISGGATSYKSEPLASAVTMSELNPRTQAEQFSIDLFFYNRAELVGRNDVQICIVRGDIKSIWGSASDLRICLQQEYDLKDDAYPYSVALFGGSFTFVSREKNWINVRIDPPRQDFGF